MSPRETPGSRSLRSHLPAALLLSLLAHGLALLAGLPLFHPAPSPAPLTVTLPPLAEETPPAEPLLKNTLEADPPRPQAPQAPAPRPEPHGPGQASAAPKRPPARDPVEAAQRKLAKHLYYPAEAVAAGLEGEVRLLLTLDADGRILDASVAAGSGHAVLDQAALRAAWALGRVDGADKREMILPVVFRLR